MKFPGSLTGYGCIIADVNVWYSKFTIIQDLVDAVVEIKNEFFPIAKIMIALMQVMSL